MFFKENTTVETKSKQELLSCFIKNFILEASNDAIEAMEDEED